MNPSLIRQARRQTPFKPFSLRANDGRVFPVMEPEHVLVTDWMLVVVDGQPTLPTLVEPSAIVDLTFVEKTELNPNGHRSHS